MNEKEAELIAAIAHLKTMCDPRGHELLDVIRDALLDYRRIGEEVPAGAFVCDIDESGGVRDAYPLTDPKSNGHHSLHADLWDVYREGK